jgi:signal peptidase II
MQAARGAALTGPPGASNPPGPPGRRRLGLLLAVAAAVYIADVVSKIIVVATLPPRHLVHVLDGVLTLQLVRNSGAAFSLGTSLTVVFTLIAVGVIIFILRTSRQLRSLPWAITLGLLLGGATGNLTDRLLRSPGLFRGDVVDWIQLPHWPVFNVADSAIVCGGLLAVLLAARGVRLDGRHDGHGQGRPGTRPHGRAHPADLPSPQTAADPPVRPGQARQPGRAAEPGQAAQPGQARQPDRAAHPGQAARPGPPAHPGPAEERGSAAGDSWA